jgi:broad specificity phosphatase PhoE
MYQSTTNPDKKFGSKFVQRRYDAEHTSDSAKQKIYCIRHGQTALDDLHRSDGWLDLPLNDEGRKNVVIVLAKHLKELPITTIFTADLLRTKETANILKSGITSDPSVKVVNDIKTWDLGSMAGDPKKPNKKVVKDLIANPHKSAPDGESYAQFTDRLDSWIEKKEKSSKKDGPFLLVLSGSACRRISELLFGDRTVLDMDEAGVFEMYPKTNGDWTAKVICGQRDENDQKKNPEAS